MRTRRETDTLATLLPGVLRRVERQAKPLQGIQARWPRLVGRALAGHTKPVSLRRGRLVVLADQPGDGFALSYQRAQVLARLARTRGCRGLVQEIVIRPGLTRGAASDQRSP